MDTSLVVMNLFIIIASAFLIIFMKRQYEKYTNSESKPAAPDTPDACSRIMNTGKVYPEQSGMHDLFKGATCSPACCGTQATSYSCDKGCVCMSNEIKNAFGQRYD